MGSTTPIHGLHYPSSGDAPNGPAQIEQLADDLDAALPVVTDTAPAAPVAGLLWYAPTADVLKFYDGTQWQTYKADTGWIPISNLAAGFTADSAAPAARQIGNRVTVRGGVVDSLFTTTSYQTGCTLPAGVALPTQTCVFPLPYPATRSVRVLTNGQIQFVSTVQSSFAYSMDVISYLTD